MHGWGGSCDSFRGLALFLSKKFRVTLVDFYGFGSTPEAIVPITLDDYVLSIVRIMREYKMSDVTLVCHSFGGRVGIKLAAKYGYMVEKLILVDSAGVKPRRGIIYFYKVLTHKILNKLKVEHNFGSEDYKKLSGTMRETFKNIVNEDLTPILSKINIRTLIIWGDKDKDTPIYMGKKLYKKIKGSELIIFEGCGHFTYVERHRAFCDIVNNFLMENDNALDSNNDINVSTRNNIVKIPNYSSK